MNILTIDINWKLQGTEMTADFIVSELVKILKDNNCQGNDQYNDFLSFWKCN